MRAQQVLAVILAAFAAASLIAALTTIRQVRMEPQERPFSHLRAPHQHLSPVRLESAAPSALRVGGAHAT
jgi:hypothetical protein